MRLKLAALLIAVTVSVGIPAGALSSSSSPGIAAGRVPQARALRSCAGAGPYWPTMTVALSGSTAWIACKDQARLVRMALPSGRRTASVRLDGQVIAVAVGLGSVWALDAGSTLYRLNPRTARVASRIPLDATAAYNIWVGDGAVWVADDQGARVLRISPGTNKIVARISVGDGPADMVFVGKQAWVMTHRDNTLYRIDTATNVATRLAVVGGSDAAAERLAAAGDSLWITGRGVPLLEVDPETGETRRSVDIDGTGIDIVAKANALWVPSAPPPSTGPAFRR